jgi:hypothetical protein
VPAKRNFSTACAHVIKYERAEGTEIFRVKTRENGVEKRAQKYTHQGLLEMSESERRGE